MRSLRREFLSVLSVLAVPSAVVLFFPFEALTFRASPAPSECAASAAFVTLSPEQEAAALVAARTSWQSDSAARQRRHVRLPLGELPEATGGPLLKTDVFLHPSDSPAPLDYRPEPWKPSQRSERPVRLVPEAEARPAPAFSREELLQLN